MTKIGVIGSEGFVGNAFCRMIGGFYEVVRHDPTLGDQSASIEEVNECALAVVCVPTPAADDGSCDTTIVESAVSWLNTPVILLESTVAPGTTDYLSQRYDKRIVMSPEYIGEGRYYVPLAKDLHRDITAAPMVILGGDEQDCTYVADLLVPILGPEKMYYTVSAVEAELIKYMENFFIGLKVSFANEMYEICQTFGANWYKIWRGWALDPRVSAMHTAVFPNARGFSGKCLPKDISALAKAAEAKGYDARLVKECLASNDRFTGLCNTKDD